MKTFKICLLKHNRKENLNLSSTNQGNFIIKHHSVITSLALYFRVTQTSLNFKK